MIFKRAEEYVKEYRKSEREVIRLKRQARQHGNFYVPSESKLAFVIRIRGYVIVINFFKKVLMLFFTVLTVCHQSREKFCSCSD